MELFSDRPLNWCRIKHYAVSCFWLISRKLHDVRETNASDGLIQLGQLSSARTCRLYIKFLYDNSATFLRGLVL